MLSAPGELAEAPDGNGGMYVALRESGVLSRLQKEGVTGIFQFGVDNVRRARPAPRPALRPALRPLRPPSLSAPPPPPSARRPPPSTLLTPRVLRRSASATWPYP